MFGEKNKSLEINKLAILTLAFVLLLNISIVILWSKFQMNYVNYQENYVDEIKDEISEYLTDYNTLSSNIESMENEYNFEIVILDKSHVIYSSNGIETIEQQEKIYDNHYIFKEEYEENGYKIWICINGVDFSEYINLYLFVNVILTSIIVIAFIIFLYVFLKRVVNSLMSVYKLIVELKLSNAENFMDENMENSTLDSINDELLHLISQLSLSYHNVKSIESENNKIIKYQKSLLEEQKQFLETAIHDIKTPISSIGYSLYGLNRNYSLNEDVAKEIDYIYHQTQNTMQMVINSLETVRDDSLEVFIEEDNVLINEIVEKNFTDSEVILSKRNIKYSIQGSECVIYTNRIKVIQMLNNITSNMIMYGADNSEMSIVFEDTKVVFKNEFETKDNKYTTKRGKKFIMNIAEELGFIFVENKNGNIYTLSIDFGEHNTLC